VANLMEALQRSLANAKKAGSAAKPPKLNAASAPKGAKAAKRRKTS
jgi:hypothetical protein